MVPSVWKQTCLESQPRLFLVINNTQLSVYGTTILFDICMPVQVYELVSQCTWQVTVELVSIYSLRESCPLFCWDKQRECKQKEDAKHGTGTTWEDRGEWSWVAGTREVFRKWSECHTDVETRGSELPASVLHCSGGKERMGVQMRVGAKSREQAIG